MFWGVLGRELANVIVNAGLQLAHGFCDPLAEFESVVDAVQCGVAVQKEFQTRNADLPENRQMQFRIGINLGDVIEEGDRIYGDGVNIAARLEALADPGGIRVSKKGRATGNSNGRGKSFWFFRHCKF